MESNLAEDNPPTDSNVDKVGTADLSNENANNNNGQMSIIRDCRCQKVDIADRSGFSYAAQKIAKSR